MGIADTIEELQHDPSVPHAVSTVLAYVAQRQAEMVEAVQRTQQLQADVLQEVLQNQARMEQRQEQDRQLHDQNREMIGRIERTQYDMAKVIEQNSRSISRISGMLWVAFLGLGGIVGAIVTKILP